MDVMLGSPLGAHALALIIPIFVLLAFFKGAAHYKSWQQAILVAGLMLMYQLIFVCIYGFMGMSPASYHYFLSPLTAMLVWIFMVLLLKRAKK